MSVQCTYKSKCIRGPCWNVGLPIPNSSSPDLIALAERVIRSPSPVSCNTDSRTSREASNLNISLVRTVLHMCCIQTYRTGLSLRGGEDLRRKMRGKSNPQSFPANDGGNKSCVCDMKKMSIRQAWYGYIQYRETQAEGEGTINNE